MDTKTQISEAIKHVRKLLSKRFKETKFEIEMYDYSTIIIKWTDGVGEEKVILHKIFEPANFEKRLSIIFKRGKNHENIPTN